jgi:hypothetical protein
MNDAIFNNAENVIMNEVKKAAEKIGCIKVGKIVKFNEDDGTVMVKLQSGVSVNCLLFQLAGVGAFIDFEKYEGMDCVVLFNDDDLTRFKSNDETARPVDVRKHTLNNGIALCGVFPFGKRGEGKKHFVSYEELNEKLEEWTEKLLDALNNAMIPQTASGNPLQLSTLFTISLPDVINISKAKVEGITYNDKAN